MFPWSLLHLAHFIFRWALRPRTSELKRLVAFADCKFQLLRFCGGAWWLQCEGLNREKSQVFSHEVRAKPKQVDRGYVSASKLTGLADLQQTVQTAQTCERTGAWEEKVEEAVTEGLDCWFQLALPRKTSHLGYSSPPLSHLNVITVRFKPLDTNTQITEL